MLKRTEPCIFESVGALLEQILALLSYSLVTHIPPELQMTRTPGNGLICHRPGVSFLISLASSTLC